MTIVLIGTGNTATVLGRKLLQAGHNLLQVYGRDATAAAQLAGELSAAATTAWHQIKPGADLYLIAVSDNAIREVFEQLTLPARSIVVHTAASVPLDAVRGKTNQWGVFYPLQSLKKEVSQLPDIPILVDANDNETLQQLQTLAATFTDRVYVARDAERLKMHMAAVMVNNFSNHLYALVETFCKKEGLDFRLLLPLVLETALRLKEISPADAQTGPAVRNDTTTIDKHLSLLAFHPELKKIYALFTESIRSMA